MLGKTTEYAIRSLVYIYLKNIQSERPGFKEIAENIDSPEGFTGKILQILTRAKLISSMKGRGGGFFFDKPEEPLPLIDIIVVTEGEEFFYKCGFGLQACDANNPCPMHDEYAEVRNSFHKLVNKLTIQSLALKVNQNKAVLKRLLVN